MSTACTLNESCTLYVLLDSVPHYAVIISVDRCQCHSHPVDKSLCVIKGIALNHFLVVWCSDRGNSEKMGQWVSAKGLPQLWEPGVVTPSYRCNLCNLVHLGKNMQQKMYNTVFNFDFLEIILMSSCHSKVAWGIDATFKCGTEFTISAVL